ncbi:MAG: hypothetical protein HC794_06050 [Nitrospiraceae bacterium]|nr:hypothetical protein [Nitrospiraceae bacterium]
MASSAVRQRRMRVEHLREKRDAVVRLPMFDSEMSTTVEVGFRLVLPAMLPTMVDNLRITLGWCWTYVVVAGSLFLVGDVRASVLAGPSMRAAGES